MDLGGAKEIVANRVSRQTETSDLVVLTWLYFLVLPKQYKIMNFFHSFKHTYSGNYYTTFVSYLRPTIAASLSPVTESSESSSVTGRARTEVSPQGTARCHLYQTTY